MVRPSLLPAGLAALVVAGALWAVSLVPVPYVTLLPGPTVDTLGDFEGQQVVTVTGAATYPSEGELLFTTVGVLDNRTVGSAVRAWLDQSRAVVPRETIYPPGLSTDETREINEALFVESESNATAAALRFLGYPTAVTVVDVSEDGPSAGKLQAGDVVTSVAGRPVTTWAEVATEIGRLEPGSQVTIGYERDGVAGQTTIVTEPSEQVAGRSVIGVVVSERSAGPVDVEISAEDVGGPSAGLMLALGIVDELTPEDLTTGATVAGTGTITPVGLVGPIGGIRQKVIAAYDAGARIFLLPPANCADARATAPDGLQLVAVKTLEEAVGVLRDPGGTHPSCPTG